MTTAAGPLVVVTRAAGQAGSLRRRLEAAGYGVLEVPVMSVAEPADGGRRLRDALDRLAEYDWLVVTSPNGAARVGPALDGLAAGARPAVAVVGPGTQAALGRPADLMAGTSIGEGVVADFPAGPGRVLLVQAEAARPVVAEGLAGKGWQVDAVVGYRTVAATPPPEALAALDRADAVVFTSGSTVRHFVRALTRAGAGRGLPPVVVSIGPATTAVAAELGVRVTVTADPHTLDGVVAALARHLPPGPGR